MKTGGDWPELGHDPLDPPVPAGGHGWLRLPRRRPMLGVRAIAAPAFVFLLLGAALGPRGLGLLSPAALGHLDIVISVALAMIGVFVGLSVSVKGSDPAGSSIAAGAMSAAVTIVTVTGGLYFLVGRWGVALAIDPLALACVLGICSSVSAAVHVAGDAPEELRRAARLADLDDVPLIVLGVTAVAMLAGGSAAERLLLTALAGAAIGFAGWLLFERASDAAERGVFVTGAILLLAGAASYLGTSPLLSGCVAALVWVRAPGVADRITSEDLSVLQHPLVVLLLLVAGALIEWSAAVLWLAAALVLLRLVGKLLASLAIARVARISPALLASVLLPPGIMGIALALNVRQVLAAEDNVIVPAVTVAAVATEILAAFLPAEQQEEAA